MGISTQQAQGAIFNIRYSSFFGGLYLSTPESEALIAEGKALVGETEVRKGYTGRSGSTAKALAAIRPKGFELIQNLNGQLNSIFVRDVTTPQGPVPYANIGFSDESGRYYISAPIGVSGVQMLIRKLMNATPGVNTDVNLFASYDKSENPAYAGRFFSSHGASLKQGGTQVPAASAAELQAIVEKQLQALKDANMSDSTVINAARSKAGVQYHLGLMTQLSAKFDAYWEANKGTDNAPAAATSTEAAADVAKAAPAAGFDDFEDDIPFDFE